MDPPDLHDLPDLPWLFLSHSTHVMMMLTLHFQIQFEISNAARFCGTWVVCQSCSVGL